MIAMLSAVSSFSTTLPATVAKVTLVLGAAGIISMILFRASAAVRHLVWFVALASCATLAIAAPVAPRIDVPVQDARRVSTIFSQGEVYRIGASRTLPMAIVGPRAVTVRAEPIEFRMPVVVSDETARASSSDPIPFLLVGIWALGFIVVVTRARLGHSRVASILDDAQRLTTSEWRTAIRDASIDVGLRREVEVFESDEIASPMTAGFLNPVVVLPMEARDWSAERRYIVLVHELAHVARFDYFAQIVAMVTCAIFWFHPLVWLASARLRAEAEHAADDHVLRAGTVGVRYAEHLLDIARRHSGELTPAVAVGMVRSSRLEGRFRAMLDSTRSRASVSRGLQAMATSLTLCAMIPLAGLRTVSADRAVVRTTIVAPRVLPAVSVAIAAPERVVIEERRAQRAATIAVAIAATTDSTFEKTIDASSGDKLTLDLRSGGAITIHGWDEPRIRVVGRLAGRDWRDTRVSLERVSGGIRLRSDMDAMREESSTSHEFEIWAPRHTSVQLSSAGGSLAINDLSGDFRGHTGGGGITIENATGSATLTTGGGEISIANSRLSGTVTTGGGELTVTNVTGGLRGSSGSGGSIVTNTDGISTVRGGFGVGGSGGAGYGISTSGGFGGSTAITTRRSTNETTVSSSSAIGGVGRGINVSGRSVAVTSGGSLMISKDGGEIIIDSAPDGAVLQTGGGRIVVGASERGVSANTGGGDIELENVGGDANASTGNGNVRISVVNARQSDHNIDVQSGRGRVVIEVPASLDARIELESAYTDNFNRRTTIQSDFALENSETDQWDGRFGTPRKYVRAVGVVGNGRGLIRVHTVNGDVVLKRVNR